MFIDFDIGRFVVKFIMFVSRLFEFRESNQRGIQIDVGGDRE